MREDKLQRYLAEGCLVEYNAAHNQTVIQRAYNAFDIDENVVIIDGYATPKEVKDASAQCWR